MIFWCFSEPGPTPGPRSIGPGGLRALTVAADGSEGGHCFWSFLFFTKESRFSCIFSAFYGQRSVATPGPTPSPLSIMFSIHKLYLIVIKIIHKLY